ncbi:MAG: hypothetical protein PHU25_10645 [Deltaproteobacteria bacterium]|nr:hypothetical protein [Deltaproteobacteria bacterium]
MLQNTISRMTARERRLAIAMLGSFGAMIVFVSVFLVRSSMSDMIDENAEMADALRLISLRQQDYLDRQREIDRRGRGTAKPTPLRTLVDKISKELGVEVPDIKELPDQKRGTQWIENSVVLSIREVGLEKMTRFMESVEGNRKKFPIAITDLQIRKRRRVPDVYDVEITISTYEQRRAENAAGGKRPVPPAAREGAN